MARKISVSGFSVSRRGKTIAIAVAAFVLLLIAVSWALNWYVSWLWFSEAGYTRVLSTMLWTRIGLFFSFGALAATIVGANMYLAYRLRPSYRPMSTGNQGLERYRLVVTPRFGWLVTLVASLVGLLTGASAQGKWKIWLAFQNSVPFGVKDPQFGKDLSFYVFEYPFWRYLLSVLFVALILSIIVSMVVHYLYGNIRLQGDGGKLSSAVIVHLSVLFGVFIALKAVSYYFDRFGMLTGHSSITKLNGAAAVDVEYLIPAKNILLWISALCAIVLFINIGIKRVLLPGMALVLLLVSAVVVGGIVPAAANQFSIKPNASDREAKYIGRNILATRQAYGLNSVGSSNYQASTNTTQEKIATDQDTVDNARVLDPEILSDTFTQLQQVRSFYNFTSKLDVDRYRVSNNTRDYVVGVRELDSSRLSGNQTNWINRHTVYTHGYGLVAAPANQVDGAGAPIFVSGALGDTNDSEQAKRFSQSVPVKQQRIYYGELINDYSIVGKEGARDREFDRPTASNKSGSEQVNTTYSGKGGVHLNSALRKLAFAVHYKEKNFLLSSAINDKSKVLYVRNPRARVEKAAPFLTMDGDPYPAIVGGRVVWILDGYTTSDSYPYSQRQSLGNTSEDSSTGQGTAAQPSDKINYIRNSVKATVDAYDGTVKLYTWDSVDPVLKVWNKAFGNIVKPRKDIPKDLVSHFRYPEDMFKVQRETWSRYHVSNPQEFFNGQDFWKVPEDPTHSGKASQPPYYLVARYPNQQGVEFQLTTALTANKRENLAAMMTGSYSPNGNPILSVFELSGNTAVPGPNQAQPKMRNDPDVRQQLSLLNSSDSTIVYGNLLTLPVGGGLLYIEPIYVRSNNNNSYPLLEKVLVSFGDRVGYERTLSAAIGDMFSGSNNADQSPPADNGANNSDQGNNNSDNSQTPSSSELNSAVGDINSALDALSKAQKEGDFTGIGKAESDLANAIKRYQDAAKK